MTFPNTSHPKRIDHRRRAKQITSFANLTTGATDVDGLIEYHDRCYVIFEIKRQGAEVPAGQAIALSRLCDDLARTKPTLLVIAEHNEPDPEQDIDAASAIVRRYRYKGQWRTPKKRATVKEVTDRFLVNVGGLF
jgi:hypothetical protein